VSILKDYLLGTGGHSHFTYTPRDRISDFLAAIIFDKYQKSSRPDMTLRG